MSCKISFHLSTSWWMVSPTNSILLVALRQTENFGGYFLRGEFKCLHFIKFNNLKLKLNIIIKFIDMIYIIFYMHMHIKNCEICFDCYQELIKIKNRLMWIIYGRWIFNLMFHIKIKSKRDNLICTWLHVEEII